MDIGEYLVRLRDFAVYLAFESNVSAAFWAVVICLFLLINRKASLLFIWRRLNLVHDKALENEFLAKVDRPLKLILLLLAIMPFFELLPGKLATPFLAACGFSITLLGCSVIAETLDLIVFHWYFGHIKQTVAPPVLRFVLQAVIYLSLGLMLLQWTAGINVLPVLATSTVMTAVLGLALQDTLKNLFAGLTMSFEKRFLQGDWVMYKPDPVTMITAEVIEIGWRTTSLRTTENSIAIVPNAVFTNSQLINLSRPTPSCPKVVDIPIDPAADVEKVRKAIIAGAVTVEGVLKEPEPVGFVTVVKTDQLNFRLRFWIDDFNNGETVLGAVTEKALTALIKLNAMPPPPPQYVVRLPVEAGKE